MLQWDLCRISSADHSCNGLDVFVSILLDGLEKPLVLVIIPVARLIDLVGIPWGLGLLLRLVLRLVLRLGVVMLLLLLLLEFVACLPEPLQFDARHLRRVRAWHQGFAPVLTRLAFACQLHSRAHVAIPRGQPKPWPDKTMQIVRMRG